MGRPAAREEGEETISAVVAVDEETNFGGGERGRQVHLFGEVASFSPTQRVFERAPRRAIATANLSPLCFLPFRSQDITKHPTDRPAKVQIA